METGGRNGSLYVGTSGWSYPWNEGGNLAWYVNQSRLNAVELNFSFYRFPTERQIRGWVETGMSLSWCVKVHRIITHRHFLNEAGRADFSRFLEFFQPIDPFVAYYLFQFPPKFGLKFADRVRALLETFDDRKMALEFRSPEWFSFDFGQIGFRGAVVTPDSPAFSGKILAENGRVYLRFHGRRAWYADHYSEDELIEVVRHIRERNPKSVHALFNNDHGMLSNARLFREIAGPFFAPGKGAT